MTSKRKKWNGCEKSGRIMVEKKEDIQKINIMRVLNEVED